VNRQGQRIATVTAAVHGTVHACVLLLPPFIVDLRAAFGVSLLAVAAAANAMYLAFGLAAIPGGWLADRFGSRRVLAMSAAGCALATAAAALAPSFGPLVAALVLLGACAGLHHPSGLSLVSRGVQPADRGRAMGIHGLGGSLGEALGPLGAALAARALGWRYGFATASALAVVCAALVVVYTGPLEGAPPPPVLAPRGKAALRSSLKDLGSALRGFWRSAPLRWLLLAGLAGGFVYRGVLTFLPLHLSGATPGDALPGAGLITLVLLAGTAAQVLGGTLADRMPRERLFVVELMLFAPVLLLLGVGSGTGGVAMALGFGFLWSLAQPLSAALAATHAEARDHGLLYGVQLALSFGLGSFATLVGAALTTWGGTRLAFLGFGAAGVVQVAAAIGLLRASRASVPGRLARGGVSASVG
jgi:MFS family permease